MADIPESTGRRNYKVVQKLLAMRPVYEIYDEQTGQVVAIAKQTWMSFLRSTMHIEDPQGNRILTAKGGFFDKTFWLLDASENKVAKLTRPWIAFRQNFTIHYRDEELKAQGGFLAWGFEALNSQGVFAFRLDKKILAVRDQSRIQVGDYMDELHAVAAALVVDRIFFKGKGCGCRLLLCCLAPIIVILIMTMLLLMPLLVP
ncbi:MAG: hypothetical protein P1Q69_04395 [Candidatus Thorarchaeota archaeon]|nr:hypothetical protein [Candidatus Thorarchaeota archaeon]